MTNSLSIQTHSICIAGARQREATSANRKLAEGFCRMVRELSKEEEELLFDPQTSGGLLISIPSAKVDLLITALKKGGVETAALVGEVVTNTQASVWIT